MSNRREDDFHPQYEVRNELDKVIGSFETEEEAKANCFLLFVQYNKYHAVYQKTSNELILSYGTKHG